ncbi:Uncharacterized protein HZ326_5651 [Fusarium oxysporum f. sp. albedinis]|nr:Uncharacterized protein HZ326_5651 [Fusarium oxysporum f. sp. albedinis]
MTGYQLDKYSEGTTNTGDGVVSNRRRRTVATKTNVDQTKSWARNGRTYREDRLLRSSLMKLLPSMN